MIHGSRTGLGHRIPIRRGTHDHVREAVAVHVPGSGHALAKGSLRRLGYGARVGIGHAAGPAGSGTTPPIYEERALRGPQTRVVARRAHGHVRITVCIHVAHTGHARAQSRPDLAGRKTRQRVAWITQDDPVLVPGEEQRETPTRVVGGAQEHVPVAISIHVSRARDARTCSSSRFGRVQGPTRDAHGAAGDPAGAPQEHEATPRVHHRQEIVIRSPDDHVRVAIRVHVPGTRHAGTQRRILLPGGDACRVGGVTQPVDSRWTPVKDERRAFVGQGEPVVTVCPHDQIRVAVSIHVTRTGDADPEARSHLVGAQFRPCVQRREHRAAAANPIRTAVENEGGSSRGGRPGYLVPPGAHYQVSETVPIHIPQTRHAVAELARGLVTVDRDIRPTGFGPHDPRGRTRENESRPGIQMARVVVVRGADDHVRMPVPVEIPGARHRGPEMT